MKLGCNCGHIIGDSTDRLPYKAVFHSDSAFDDLFLRLQDLATYAAAVRDGEVNQWVRARSEDPHFHLSLKEADMLHDLVLMHVSLKSRDIYECENCGRLWVEDPDRKTMHSYLPESGRSNRPFAKD